MYVYMFDYLLACFFLLVFLFILQIIWNFMLSLKKINIERAYLMHLNDELIQQQHKKKIHNANSEVEKRRRKKVHAHSKRLLRTTF